MKFKHLIAAAVSICSFIFPIALQGKENSDSREQLKRAKSSSHSSHSHKPKKQTIYTQKGLAGNWVARAQSIGGVTGTGANGISAETLIYFTLNEHGIGTINHLFFTGFEGNNSIINNSSVVGNIYIQITDQRKGTVNIQISNLARDIDTVLSETLEGLIILDPLSGVNKMIANLTKVSSSNPTFTQEFIDLWTFEKVSQ